MKTVIKVFNIVFLALAALAMTTLFTSPTLSVNANLTMTAEQIAKAMPSSGGEEDIDVAALLEGETIHVGLTLSVQSKMLVRSLSDDPKTVIDEEFIDPNVNSVVLALRDPIYKVGKGMLKQTATKNLITKFESAIDDFKESSDSRTAEQIRLEAGLNDSYFVNLSESVFEVVTQEEATVTKVNDVMFDGISRAVSQLNNANVGVTVTSIDESYKSSLRSTTKELLSGLKMVKSDGETLYPFNVVMDAMLADVFRQTNNEEIPEGETIEEKAEKLMPILTDFIKKTIPTDAYDTIALALKALLGVLGLFLLVWAFFFIFTLVRTILGFCGKPKMWTFTGPIFWIFGFFQIILGLVVTVASSVLLNGEFLSSMMKGAEGAEMLKGLTGSISTSMLIPSIIVLVMFPACIVYGVFKRKYKRSLKQEKAAE